MTQEQFPSTSPERQPELSGPELIALSGIELVKIRNQALQEGVEA